MKHSRLDTTLLYACYFFIGFALLSLEVIWGRLTALPLGSSIHAYSITLAAVMAGLFCGTWHGNKVSTRVGLSRLFTYMICFTVMAGITSISFVYLSESFKFWRFSVALSVKGAYYLTLAQVSFAVFVPAFFSGAVFPIATQILVPDIQHAGRTAGNLYMMNSMGAISGCLLTGFILIEGLGLKNAAIICSLLPAIPAMMFFLFYRSYAKSLVIFALMISLVAATHEASFPKTPFSIYMSQISDTSEQFDRDMSRLKVLQEYESVHGFTRVMGSPRGKFLQVNNKNESDFMGADLSVEINPDVHAAFASHFFPELKDSPKIDFIFQEARYYLMNTDRKYDIITLEPSYPTDGVTASLYTRESFRTLRHALTPDGLLSLFIPVHVLGPKYTEGVVKTILTELPYVQIWNIGEGADLILVAGMKPFQAGPEEVKRRVSRYTFPHYGHLAGSLRFPQPNSVLDKIKVAKGIPVYTDDSIELEVVATSAFLL
jgi:spermidine synthase